jgi:predicted nuclease of predicted toxin-antitoxin system
MRFKLDENFGTRAQSLFLDAGHEVETVRSQGLQGAANERLYAICRAEGYCLVTLDLDFADVLRFPPFETNGIVVIRVPVGPSLELLMRLARQFLLTVLKCLWKTLYG